MTDISFVEHITVEGQRYDELARIYFGDPSLTIYIYWHNPGLPRTGKLPGGIKVYLPVLTPEDVPDTLTTKLPPWLQP